MAPTISTSVPAAYAALMGFIQTEAALQDPPVIVFPAELEQYEPGSYIIVSTVEEHHFEIEAMGYTHIESYNLTGLCTVFTGDAPSPGPVPPQNTVAQDVMAQTYALFTDIVAYSVVNNRGGDGVPVLGIATYPFPYEILFGYARYSGSPGNLGGGQGGWQGTVQWSFSLKAYLTPA